MRSSNSEGEYPRRMKRSERLIKERRQALAGAHGANGMVTVNAADDATADSV